MDYKAEPVELGFGKGVSISRDDRTYEQYSARDDLTVRLFRMPYKHKGRTKNKDYQGIIYRPPFISNDPIISAFAGNSQYYHLFEELTDKLTVVSGQKIKNSTSDFIGYTYDGLDQKLGNSGILLRYNLENKEDLPSNILSFLNRRSHLGGAITDIIAYGAGYAIIAGIGLEDPGTVYAMYGIITPLIEGALGLQFTVGRPYWCGPLHVPGFFVLRYIYEKKLFNPNYVLDRFMENYQKLETVTNTIGNQKQFSKLLKKVDRHYGMIQELFPYTTNQKGLSIYYRNPDREKVVELFSYLLEGGNVPQLTIQTKVTKKQKQEPIEVQPDQTDFINPWEVEIPRLGE